LSDSEKSKHIRIRTGHTKHIFQIDLIETDILLMENQPESALHMYHKIEKQIPQQKHLYIRMGQSYIQVRKYKDAERAFIQAIGIDGDNHQAHHGLTKQVGRKLPLILVLMIIHQSTFIYILKEIFKKKESFMNRLFVLLSIALLLVQSNTVFSAGFDCKKASTKVEKLICGNSVLNALDEMLNQTYSKVKKQLPKKEVDSLKNEQKKWVTSRNKSLCKDTKSCISAYCARLRILQNVLVSPFFNEVNKSFTYRKKVIHPGLIKEFEILSSDYDPPMTVAVDIGAAFKSNEYSEDIETSKDGWHSITVPNEYEEGAFYKYKWLGKIKPDIHILKTLNWEGGSMVESSVICVTFSIRNGYDVNGLPSQRLTMNVVKRIGANSESDIKLLDDSIICDGSESVFY